jgi:Domain of unknown function (DUF4276)
MLLEILVEGKSECTALEPLLTKILGNYKNPHIWRIHKHGGVGKLPPDFLAKPNPKDKSLLHNLPSKLRAYGKSLQDDEAVVVLIDLDDRPDSDAFEQELVSLLNNCAPTLKCKFFFAIEELEAWYFGDKTALKKTYPAANDTVLDAYIQDAQCGTWEKLADAIYPDGLNELKKLGCIQQLQQKRIWARDIAPKMDINNNQSPSFCAFRDGLRELTGKNVS